MTTNNAMTWIETQNFPELFVDVLLIFERSHDRLKSFDTVRHKF